MPLNGKRDRIQIIADILNSCRRPQTQTYIRRQTTVSYSMLQTCINQLLLKQWLIQVDDGKGKKKIATTKKGLTFLNKWVELQKIMSKDQTQKMKKSFEFRNIVLESEQLQETTLDLRTNSRTSIQNRH